MAHPLTPREKVPYTLNEISGEIRRRYPAAFDGSDPIGTHPPSLENATDLFLAACLTALASGSGDHAELARSVGKAIDANIHRTSRLYSVRTGERRYGVGGQAAATDAIMAVVSPLLAENAALKYAVQNGNEHLEFWENRATEAERKLAEAVGLNERAADLMRQCTDPERFEVASTLNVYANMRAWLSDLSKEAERG